MLENLLNSISSNPAYLAVTIVLMAMIAFSVIKRLFRLVVLGITLLIIYYAYIIFTGQPLPELDDIQNRCVVNVCILYILNISQFAFLE